MLRKYALTTSIAVACIASTVQASIVVEAEPNNSIATAQNIDGFFSLDFDANIGDSTGANTSTTIPHASILGTGDGTFDFFSFTVPTAGSIGIFDIDFGINVGVGSFDAELFLLDSAGNSLTFNDDFSRPATVGAGGSISGLDSFIQTTFASAGTFIIAVGEFPSSSALGGPTGNTPDPGDTYTLQVSIQNAATDSVVPEPTMSLVWAGLACCGTLAAKRCR